MILFTLVIVIAILLGFVFGGSLSRFEGLRLRWWILAVLGFAVQFVPLPEGAGGTDLVVRTAALTVSYSMLVAFAIANVRIEGMALVLIGLACNFAVIAANGGMPVSAQALIDSGQIDVLVGLEEAGSDKHHLLTDEDVLTLLADVIPVGAPFHQAISAGDLLIYGGLVWLTVAVMLGRIPPPNSTAWGPYRGKHRQGLPDPEPEPMWLPPPPPPLPAATRSGTGR